MSTNQSDVLDRIAKALERIANAQEGLLLVESFRETDSKQEEEVFREHLDVRLASIENDFPLTDKERKTFRAALAVISKLYAAEDGKPSNGLVAGADHGSNVATAADAE